MISAPGDGQTAADDPLVRMMSSLELLRELPNRPAEAPWGDPNEPGLVKAVVYGAIDVDDATCAGEFACVARVGTMLVGAIRPTEQAQRRGFYPEHGFIDVRQLSPWNRVVLVPGQIRFSDWLSQNHEADAVFDEWLTSHGLPKFAAAIGASIDHGSRSDAGGGS